MNKIVERIERAAGVPGLAAILAERLAPTDLQSLLLEVYRCRATQRTPADVLTQYEANRFVRPSSASPVRLAAWEQTAWAHLPPGFESLALAPVCPLGTCSAIAGVDQNWAVPTARNTEVVSDSTNVLALECALRRRVLMHNGQPGAPVHLAASHRLLRGQHYDNPNLVPHFSLFALCSAGRDAGHLSFEMSALGTHVRFYLAALRAFLGPDVRLYVALTDLGGSGSSWDIDLLAPLCNEFAPVECAMDPKRTDGRKYYRAVCFHSVILRRGRMFHGPGRAGGHRRRLGADGA